MKLTDFSKSLNPFDLQLSNFEYFPLLEEFWGLNRTINAHIYCQL